MKMPDLERKGENLGKSEINRFLGLIMLDCSQRADYSPGTWATLTLPLTSTPFLLVPSSQVVKKIPTTDTVIQSFHSADLF